AAGREPHGVVVHARPDERLELQRAPDGLVRETNFPADCLVAVPAPHPRELGFDRVCLSEIERRVARRSRLDETAIRERAGELFREDSWIGQRATSPWRARAAPRLPERERHAARR